MVFLQPSILALISRRQCLVSGPLSCPRPADPYRNCTHVCFFRFDVSISCMRTLSLNS